VYSLPAIDIALSIVYAHNMHNLVPINIQTERHHYVCRCSTAAAYIFKQPQGSSVVKVTNESQQCSTVEVEDVPRGTKGEE
jgi:hypothetical protein